MITLKNLNRQVNVWRGNTPPPTTFHIWLDDKDIKIYDDSVGEWVLVNANGTTSSAPVNKEEIEAIISEYMGGITINGKDLDGDIDITADDITYNTISVKTALDEIYTTLIY